MSAVRDNYEKNFIHMLGMLRISLAIRKIKIMGNGRGDLVAFVYVIFGDCYENFGKIMKWVSEIKLLFYIYLRFFIIINKNKPFR